jgi:hypothetical protein
VLSNAAERITPSVRVRVLAFIEIPFLSLPGSVRQSRDDTEAAALRRPVSVIRREEDRNRHHFQDKERRKLEPQDGEKEIAWGRQGGSVQAEHVCMRLQPRQH